MSGPASAAPALDAALCILGAGFAGMNALAVASRYLGPQDRVVLVDRRPRCGGMWHDTYDFVRLHQPHPMFTAGDIAWRTRQPPWHLASKPEVLAHFEHCLAELRRDRCCRRGRRAGCSPRGGSAAGAGSAWGVRDEFLGRQCSDSGSDARSDAIRTTACTPSPPAAAARDPGSRRAAGPGRGWPGRPMRTGPVALSCCARAAAGRPTRGRRCRCRVRTR